MSLPVQNLWRDDARIIQETTQIQFIYNETRNNVTKLIAISYDSWIHPCSQNGSLIFNFVVREKIEVFFMR